MCGHKNENPLKEPISSSPIHKQIQSPLRGQKQENIRCGSIVYHPGPFSTKELERDYALFLKSPVLRSPDARGPSWPIYLFGDNDIDHDRPPNTEREMVGGHSSVCGRFDDSIAFGITTTFYTFKPMITLLAFKKLMDGQFDNLWRRYMVNGHDVMVPSPSALDLVQSASVYLEDSDQVIFHNLGIELPMIYRKYIQFKMDQISALSVDRNEGLRVPAISASEPMGGDLGFGALDEMKVDDDAQSAAKDEWEEVSDFVLTEYIRDVVEEVDDVLVSIDEFMRRMEFLGVNSERSRSRALALLEELKNRKEAQRIADQFQVDDEKSAAVHRDAVGIGMGMGMDRLVDQEMAQRLADGHTMESFVCVRCHKQQDHGGIELSRCSHKICYRCLPQLVSSHIAMRMVPTCLQCGSPIHQTDLRKHVNHHTADIVADMEMAEIMAKTDGLTNCYDPQCAGKIVIEDRSTKEWKCMVCGVRNCLKCKKLHRGDEQCPPPPPPPKPIFVAPPAVLRIPRHGRHVEVEQNLGNYHFAVDEFANQWVNVNDISSSNMISTFDVPLHSNEWNKIIDHLRDPSVRKIVRIQRIQNAKVWRSFESYCDKMRRKHGGNMRVGGFWHGTRTHDPKLIWKSKGFLKSKSRIGNCLWFATENTYSMNGFQHVMSNGQHQCFLAFVCCGDGDDVKFIRSDQILNVYKDAATYPAYLLTYTSSE